MVRGSLIRRFGDLARRHAWDGVAIVLFAVALVVGAGQVAAGAEKFVESVTPGIAGPDIGLPGMTAAQASDDPSRAGDGVARLPMFGFRTSRYSPQVLFPVTGHLLPLWLELRGEFDLAPPTGGLPAIAICMDDLGEDLAGTDLAIALPKLVALSFLPYADATPFLAEEAERKGHDVLAHVPMEALSATDPGPMALKVGAPDILPRLNWNLARVPGLAGINNHEGSRFSEDEASLVPVVKVLAARHLFFFDSRTVGDSKVIGVAHRFGVMSAGRDIFLDDTLSEAAVHEELDELLAEARHDGVAIAIGHPHDVTLKVLAAWLAEDHGVDLISLPEAMRRKSQTMALAER